jgi:hypothetical protein
MPLTLTNCNVGGHTHPNHRQSALSLILRASQQLMPETSRWQVGAIEQGTHRMCVGNTHPGVVTNFEYVVNDIAWDIAKTGDVHTTDYMDRSTEVLLTTSAAYVLRNCQTLVLSTFLYPPLQLWGNIEPKPPYGWPVPLTCVNSDMPPGHGKPKACSV